MDCPEAGRMVDELALGVLAGAGAFYRRRDVPGPAACWPASSKGPLESPVPGSLGRPSALKGTRQPRPGHRVPGRGDRSKLWGWSALDRDDPHHGGAEVPLGVLDAALGSGGDGLVRRVELGVEPAVVHERPGVLEHQ